jgi:hypothetical protein
MLGTSEINITDYALNESFRTSEKYVIVSATLIPFYLVSRKPSLQGFAWTTFALKMGFCYLVIRLKMVRQGGNGKW